MRKFDNIHKFIFSLLISAYRGNIHKNSSFNIGFCVHHFRKLAKFYVLKNFRTFFIRDIHFFECWLVRIKDVFLGKCFESFPIFFKGYCSRSVNHVPARFFKERTFWNHRWDFLLGFYQSTWVHVRLKKRK